MVEAVKQGFPQREIADAAFRYQQEVESGARRRGRRQRLHRGRRPRRRRSCGSTRRSRPSRSRASASVRERRDADAVARDARARWSEAARDPGENLMPLLLEAARADVDRGRDRQALQTRVRHLPRNAGRSELRLLAVAAPLRTTIRPRCRLTEKKIRVVVAKPGLDGHDRGAKIIARALRDAGHGGDLHRAAPDARADRRDRDPGGRRRGRAVDPVRRAHDARAAGDGAAQGAGRRRRGRDASGARSPSDDVEELKQLGVAEVFTPGASTQEAVDFIRSAVPGVRRPGPRVP